jgi:hypothetical protein
MVSESGTTLEKIRYHEFARAAADHRDANARRPLIPSPPQAGEESL